MPVDMLPQNHMNIAPARIARAKMPSWLSMSLPGIIAPATTQTNIATKPNTCFACIVTPLMHYPLNLLGYFVPGGFLCTGSPLGRFRKRCVCRLLLMLRELWAPWAPQVLWAPQGHRER